MPRPVPEGFKRPARVTMDDVPVEDAMPLRDVLKSIPAHYVESMRTNEWLRDCCRNIDNLTYQRFRTHPDLENPDLAILECTECGAKHRRTAGGAGKFG